MPTVNETLVRSDCSSNSTATARAGQQGPAEPVLLHLVGQVEHRGLLGRSQVVVAQGGAWS